MKVDECKILLHDEKKDIAILGFEKVEGNFESVIIPKPALKGEHLRVGVDVAWCGYPGIGSSIIPILQKGMIAGIEDKIFDHGFAYIIDGMVNPGNSGSPAFWNFNKEVIGIVTAYVPQPSSYRLAIIGNKGPIQVFNNPSGLGLVVPIQYVIDLVFASTSK